MQDKQLLGWELRCERNPAIGETRQASNHEMAPKPRKVLKFFIANDTILCFITTWWIRETRKIPKSPHTNTTAVGEACGAVIVPKISHAPILMVCYSFRFCHHLFIFLPSIWHNVFFLNVSVSEWLRKKLFHGIAWLILCLFPFPFYSNSPGQSERAGACPHQSHFG